MSNELLIEGLERLGLPAGSAAAERLETYIDEIEIFNPAYHLISFDRREDLIIRHILDCAAGALIIRDSLGPDGVVADFGSGAGLPGIVLAVLLDDVRFVLVERMKRRCDFLANAVNLCNLSNVKVLNKDIREIDESYGLVTFRAFRPLGEIMGAVDRLLARKGKVCAYKGIEENALGELAALDSWTGCYHQLHVPFLDASRGMLVLERKGDLS